MNSNAAAAAGQYEVLIEGKVYPWDKPAINAPEIRSLGGIPADEPVIKADLTNGEEARFEEDQVHELVALEQGKGLRKHVNFRRG